MPETISKCLKDFFIAPGNGPWKSKYKEHSKQCTKAYKRLDVQTSHLETFHKLTYSEKITLVIFGNTSLGKSKDFRDTTSP